MSRVTVYHLTRPANLPLIEEDGLRTRADLIGRMGDLGDFDRAAPGRYAHGKRVSAFLSLDHARTQVEALGGGLITFTVDPRKAIAAPASIRETSAPADYWQAVKPLADFLEAAPDDLEVHQPVPVRAKHLQLMAPLFTDAQLGMYAPLVAAVADTDRLEAKALMHLAVIASDGDFDGPAFAAACAFAWRDERDSDGIIRDLEEAGPDRIASAVLAEHAAAAPEAVEALRTALEDTRDWADGQGLEHTRATFVRTALVLEKLG